MLQTIWKNKYPGLLADDEKIIHLAKGMMPTPLFFATDKRLIIVKGSFADVLSYSNLDIEFKQMFLIGKLIIREKKSGLIFELTSPENLSKFFKYVSDASSPATGEKTYVRVDLKNPGKENMLKKMNKEIKRMGISLMVIGSLGIFVPNKLIDPIWAGIVVLTGMIILAKRKPHAYIIFGCLLIVAGSSNLGFEIYEVTKGSGRNNFWIVLAILQIYLGISEVRKFQRYKNLA